MGKAILARTVEAYRKIRNTLLRYLLSNLYDFDPDRDRCAAGDLLEVDRFALARYAALAKTIEAAYERYDFQTIFQAVSEFVTVDLSAFYLDVSKDRLYTFRADSRERRSAQTACYAIADGVIRLLAPILSITADEAWQYLPGSRERSVHLAEFPRDVDGWLAPDLDARWTRLLEIRSLVNLALEGARQRKEIGSALEAHVTVRAAGADADLIERYRHDLPMLFITSSASFERRDGDLEVLVAHASGEKCPRCWRYVDQLVSVDADASLCERCVDAVGVSA